MPEYLAPGVYVEEVSFRSKSIEGVSTSTAGFVGPTRYGPVGGAPELITSFEDFKRIYGDLDDLAFDPGDGSAARLSANFLAHGVRAFFEEGGRRLFVTRVFDETKTDGTKLASVYASTNTDLISPPSPSIALRARFPGAQGNMRVMLTLRASRNVFNPSAANDLQKLSRVRDMDMVFVGKQESYTVDGKTKKRWVAQPGGTDGLFLVRRTVAGTGWELRGNGPTVALASLAQSAQVLPLMVSVAVAYPNPRTQGFGDPQPLGDFSFDPRSANALSATFQANPSRRFDALTVPFAIDSMTAFDALGDDEVPLALARELLGDVASLLGGGFNAELPYTLSGGCDGVEPDLAAYEVALETLEAVEDISIVASPGYTGGYSQSDGNKQDRVLAIQNALIGHAEKMRYRIAVLDTPRDLTPTQALDYRNKRSSKYAAIYYPWVTVFSPSGEGRLLLPPSGFVAGIYARNDIEHAVFKAPANEVVRLAIDFEQRLSKAQQELLNPDGVNCFRFFEGRGYLLWGARTISDDPEWKYVNLRRYFAYLEHSVDRGTQWAVFENNSRQLWDNVRRTIEDFLFNEWKMGALLGDKPDQAFFVRCDLSTMTQNDLDNGRLVCLIGVAPVRPAEFVIFRIGQWTASSNR